MTPINDAAADSAYARTMQTSSDPADRPLTISWELTRGAADGRPGPRMPGDLTPRECLDVVDQIAAAGPRLLLLCADVSARADATHLIARANAHGLRVALRPAVRSRFLDLDCDLLLRAGARCLSICLGDQDPTQRSPRIDIAMKMLAAARRARMAVQMRTPLPDLADLSRFRRAAQALRPQEWRLALPVHAPAGKPIDPVETEQLLTALSHLPGATGVPISISDAPQFRRIAVKEQVPLPRRPHPAPLNDGRGKLFISRRGEIFPGRGLPVAGGNVRRHHLLDVYREASVFRRLRDPDQLRGKCGSCEFRRLCGGSRARAFAVYGDYLAADPACPYESTSSSVASDFSGLVPLVA